MAGRHHEERHPRVLFGRFLESESRDRLGGGLVHGTCFGKGSEGSRSKRLIEVSIEEDGAISETDSKMGKGRREGNSCDLFHVDDWVWVWDWGLRDGVYY